MKLKPPTIASRWVVAMAVCLVAAIQMPSVAAEVVFEQTFDGLPDGTAAADLGWTVEAAPDQSLYTVENGALKVTCLHKPYKGGSIFREIPLVRKGRLEFDAWVGDANNRHLSLIVSLYEVKTSFKGYGSFRLNWDRYCPKFDREKTRYPWSNLANRISLDAFHHFALEFDAEAPRLEYFVDDMEDPVFIDTDVPVLGEGATGVLRIGNYGMCSGTVVCYVDNLRLTEGTPEVEAVAGGKRPIVVDGYGFASYRVREALAKAGALDAKHYSMELGQALQPKHRTRLARLIGNRSLASADLVILTDVTAEALGAELIDRLEEWVKQGGSLLVLGGYFTLGKGGFTGTLLEAMVPVEVAGPWEVAEAASPLLLRASDGWGTGQSLDWSARPAAMYCHRLKPKPGSRTLVRAGDVSLVTLWSYGEGRVAALTGTTAGVAPPGMVPFWDWPDWPVLLGALIKELRGETR